MPEEKSIPQVLGELKEMTVAYAKQETVDPLKGLGRYVLFGVAGSLLLALGIILLTLSGLRALQTHTDEHLTGNWNWVPYLAALVLLGILIGLAVMAIKPKESKR
jgi:ABC-type Mn2+/Zn2+ transport system permease subunit